MSALNLDELEALARKATPGKRQYQPWSSYAGPKGDYVESILFDEGGEELTRGLPDADGDLIAALDPGTVLALIERARKAEQECDALAKKIEHVREVLAYEPIECPEHPDGDPVTCGWKRDIISIRHIIDQTKEGEHECEA